MILCRYCFKEIFWINGKAFDDPEGSVKHKCQDWQKVHSDKMSDSDRINAIYNLLIRLFHETLELKQQLLQLLNDLGGKNVSTR